MLLDSFDTNLKGKTLPELEDLVVELGERPFRAKQIMHWIYQRRVMDIAAMSNLSKDFRNRLSERYHVSRASIVTCQVSVDGTRKYLFGVDDGIHVESVLIPEGKRRTACISSQAGCGIGCTFCATALGGLIRNLKPHEIIDQVLGIEDDTGERVSNVVFMGMGEPLANYENMMRSVRLMVDPIGLNIGQRHITVSTSGLVPAIRRLADEELQVVLAVSLHAPTDEKRDKIIPLNRKYPIHELLDACRYYVDKTKRRVSFEYLLIKDFNDGLDDARRLAELVRPFLTHVNLIPMNPVPETGFERPDDERITAFAYELAHRSVEVTTRRERGTDIEAACGQLRRQYKG